MLWAASPTTPGECSDRAGRWSLWQTHHVPPRRRNPDAIMFAHLVAELQRGATTSELVEVVGGRVDILERALAIAERGSAVRSPVAEHVARLRAAVKLAKG